MKCHMVTASANQAGQWGVQRAESSVGKAQKAFDEFIAAMITLKKLKPSVYSNEAYLSVVRHLSDADKHLRHVQGSCSYIETATEAGTDAAARAIRSTVQQIRTRTIGAVLNLPADKESAVQRVAQELPVVPSSLFGGRWQISLASLGQRVQRRSQLQSLLKESKAMEDAPLQISFSASGRTFKRPFPEAGGASAPPFKRKKRNKGSRAPKQEPRATHTQPSYQPPAGRGKSTQRPQPQGKASNRSQGKGKGSRRGGRGRGRGGQ